VVRVETDDAARAMAGQAYARLDQVEQALRRSRCEAVGVLGRDLVDNLAIALELRERWPGVRLAVQAQSLVDGAKLSSLFSGMQVINPLQVAADAVVATAFGERVRGVLQPGDALVVMADLQALLAVETGTLTPPRWQLEVRRCRPHCNRFEAQVLLARYLAQPPGEVARHLDTAAGPQRTEPIYQVPGRQLQQGLTRLGVECALVAC